MANRIGIDPDNRDYGVERDDDDWNAGGDPLGVPFEQSPDVVPTAGPWESKAGPIATAIYGAPTGFDGPPAKLIARVMGDTPEDHANAVVIRAAWCFWDKLNEIAFGFEGVEIAEGTTAHAMRELAREALAKR